jgi:ABC-type branched-subunit amino acid transport system permease subunit
MGYSVPRFRVALTIYSSLIASLGGWLYALQTSFVFIDLLGIGNSTNGLVYALIGGVDTIVGPFLGTALLRALTDQLARLGNQQSLFIGIVLMLVVYLLPDGILGLWRRYTRRHFPQPGMDVPETAETVAAGLTAENVEAL